MNMNRISLLAMLTLLGFAAGASAQLLIAPDPNGDINQDTSSLVMVSVGTDHGPSPGSATVDGSGLNAAGEHENNNWLSGIHWMGDRDDRENGPHSGTYSDPTGPNWIRFDFDQVYPLENAKVWNYNGAPGGDDPLRGLNNVVIEYSSDGTNWNLLDGGGTSGAHTFPVGSGLAGYTGFDLPLGVSAQHVIITMLNATAGSGNHGGGDAGLAEIRFFYPEPTSLALLVAGGLMTARRRRD